MTKSFCPSVCLSPVSLRTARATRAKQLLMTRLAGRGRVYFEDIDPLASNNLLLGTVGLIVLAHRGDILLNSWCLHCVVVKAYRQITTMAGDQLTVSFHQTCLPSSDGTRSDCWWCRHPSSVQQLAMFERSFLLQFAQTFQAKLSTYLILYLCAMFIRIHARIGCIVYGW